MAVRRSIDEAKKGSAEVVILAIVEHESHHGYEIAKLIEQRTDGSLRFTLASLYSTLYRLEDRGWIKGRWVEKAGSAAVAITASPNPDAGSSRISARTGAGSWRRSARWPASSMPSAGSRVAMGCSPLNSVADCSARCSSRCARRTGPPLAPRPPYRSAR